MTTTPPRKGPPRDRQGAHQRSHQCAHHPHVPQRTRRPVQRSQSSGPAGRTCHGGMCPDTMLWQKQALKTQVTRTSLTPISARTGHQYRSTWVKGVPISHKCEVQVHVHHHLGVDGRLTPYELVRTMWQLNVMNFRVPFGDTTQTFLEHLMEAYRQLAMTGPTVIRGDLNAAPSKADRGGRQTPEDTAVQRAMQHMGLQNLTAPLRSQPPHRPPQPGSTVSRIDLC